MPIVCTSGKHREANLVAAGSTEPDRCLVECSDCLERSGHLLECPVGVEQVQEATEAFLTHYNGERPNQARSCGNQPPRVACEQFPTLPAVPRTVDPDRWLVQVNKQAFARTIRAGGDVTINRQDYYVSRRLAGKPGHLLAERHPEAV
jgi:hypothetical protein